MKSKPVAVLMGLVLFDTLATYLLWTNQDIESIANKLGIQVVPIIGCGNLHEMVERCNTGFKSQWGDFIAEGIVARPVVELKDRAGHRIITKLKHKDFQDV
ncbi:MAG: hypothetical protein WDA59_01740 [Methanofastidiosum sp.]